MKSTAEPRKFLWLIEHLLPPNEKLRGCQAVFPDSVFFVNGKPKFIVRTDKENCLFAIRQESKLNLLEIRRTFSTIVRNRKKEHFDFSSVDLKDHSFMR